MVSLVLLRHGQSTWNRLNKFTGWTDVPLSSLGKKEAIQSGKDLRKAKFTFDVVFTSPMLRARQTTQLALKSMRHPATELKTSWRLNERHYGALQGLNKSEMAVKFGEKQVKIWRRSYDVPPPRMKKSDARFKKQCKIFSMVPSRMQPTSECLKDTVARVVPFWYEEVVPQLRAGKRVLVSAHGNSLRALVKHLDHVSGNEIVEFNIPTGIPLVYELDSKLRPVRHYFLADKKTLKAALDKVKAQGKAKK